MTGVVRNGKKFVTLGGADINSCRRGGLLRISLKLVIDIIYFSQYTYDYLSCTYPALCHELQKEEIHFHARPYKL